MDNKNQDKINAVKKFLKKEFPEPEYEIDDEKSDIVSRSHNFIICDNDKGISALIINRDCFEENDLSIILLWLDNITSNLLPKLNKRITLNKNGEITEVPNK